MSKILKIAGMALFVHTGIFAQTINVLDKTLLKGIEFVSISGKGSKTAVTDNKGAADISAFENTDTLFFLHPSFNMAKYSKSEIVEAGNKVFLSEKLIKLDEVIFSANKVEEKKKDVPYNVEVIQSKDVEFTNPQSVPDMLQNTGAVLVQKSQPGGGSPVIRGFEASRVLIVVDGVRMNNAIYRAGHLQDAMTIDANMLDRTEVLFGPSSVVYGSDALGGVMHFYTKKPVLSNDCTMVFHTNTFARYSSANTEKTLHTDFNLGFRKVAFITSITKSDFGDVRTGEARYPSPAFGYRPYYADRINGADTMMKNSDPLVQKFSAYSQTDIMEKILFRVNKNVETGLNVQYSTSSELPRYDRLTDMAGASLKYAEWSYGPQNRLLASLFSNIRSEGKMFNDMRIVAAYQDIDQERITRRFKKDNRNIQHEDLQVYSVNADLMKQVNEKNEIRYGIEGTFNHVASSAKNINIVTNVETPAATRYPDGGSTYSSIAGYLTHSWEISKKVILSEGVRYSRVGINAKFEDTTYFPFPYKTATQSNSAVNGNIGLVLMPDENVRFNILASTGFRSPNIDDLTKVFDSSPGKLIVPNPDLKPEYAYNAEAGFSQVFNEKRCRLEGNYFITLLENAMVLQPYQLNGSDSVNYMETLSQVMTMKNMDKAIIQGTTASFVADITSGFSVKSSITYTTGTYYDSMNDTLYPLDHIPPVYGQTSIIHKYKRVQTEFFIRYNGEKKLRDYSPSGEDNLNYATAMGMPRWMTLNLRGSIQATSYLRVNVGVENLLNVHYRVFASGISAPGRNLYISLRGNF